jgi:hypothetical protein
MGEPVFADHFLWHDIFSDDNGSACKVLLEDPIRPVWLWRELEKGISQRITSAPIEEVIRISSIGMSWTLLIPA